MLLELRSGKGNQYRRAETIVGYATVADDDYSTDVLSKLAWCLNAQGYPRTRINGKIVRLHHMVYRHYKGAIPDGLQIDHIDRDKLNAHPDNLRAVTQSVNTANCPKRKNNTSGYIDVGYDNRRRIWRASIKVNYKSKHLGYFTNKEDAARAVNEAYKIYFPDVPPPNPEVA